MAAKKRLELGPVERLAADVGEDLHADRAELIDGALHLATPASPEAERGVGDEAREVLGMLGHQLGQPVVADLGELQRNLRAALADGLQRRRRQRQDLRVVGELLDHLEARVEVVDGFHGARAPEHVLQVAADLLHLLVVAGGIEVIEGVDAFIGVPPERLGAQSSRSCSRRDT